MQLTQSNYTPSKTLMPGQQWIRAGLARNIMTAHGDDWDGFLSAHPQAIKAGNAHIMVDARLLYRWLEYRGF